MVPALVCVAACGLLLGSAHAAKRFHQGNSLTGPLTHNPHRFFHTLAGDAGIANDSDDSIIIAGTPIELAWNNNKAQFLQKFQTGAPFDFIIIQPFRHQNTPVRDWLPKEAIAGAELFRAALQWNPNATMVVYYTWGSWYTNDTDVTWESRMTNYIAGYFEYFTDIMQQEITNAPIVVVPAAQVLVELSRAINGGQIPGLSSMSELYYKTGAANQVHLNGDGYYASAMTHFGTYYRCPTGLPYRYTMTAYFSDEGTQVVTFTAAQAAAVQALAWHVLTNYPRSRVSGTARQKPDWQPPSAPQNVALGPIATNGQAALSWTACTDNVGVAFYTVYVDAVHQKTVTTTNYTVTGLTNLPQKITVRAWDAEYNFAGTSVMVPEAGALSAAVLLTVGIARSK